MTLTVTREVRDFAKAILSRVPYKVPYYVLSSAGSQPTFHLELSTEIESGLPTMSALTLLRGQEFTFYVEETDFGTGFVASAVIYAGYHGFFVHYKETQRSYIMSRIWEPLSFNPLLRLSPATSFPEFYDDLMASVKEAIIYPTKAPNKEATMIRIRAPPPSTNNLCYV